MEGFRLEWNLRQIVEPVHTVYFGGGTPALFHPERIGEILSWIPLESNAEITLEANPENITCDLIKRYADCGINRVSIGLQSLNDDLLQTLGRIHHAKKGIESVFHTAKAGIQNISVDLMYDLPGQQLAHWKKTLEEVAHLPITHLSLYNLTLEPHTVFFKKKEVLARLIPDPDLSLQMYTMAIESMERQGFKQYEISAFAKPGFQSRHNLGYWTGREFLGFGPSAYSYKNGKRFRNIAHLGKYLSQLKMGAFPIDFEEQLDPEASLRELLAIRLRLLEGVEYRGNLLEIEKLISEGFLEKVEGRLKLTRRGILFYDTVAVEII